VPNAPRIELPRPAIFAAIGVLILAVTFFVTHGSETGSAPSTGSSSSASSTGTTATTTTSASTSTSTSSTTTKKPAEQAPPAVQPGQGLPADVSRALNRHQVVVLFFWEPAGADDQATRAAVRAVRSVPTARLFSDTVAHISNYRRVIGGLGISQTPAMVVIDRKRNARLFEGFLDAGTIKQSVRDAL
jgi:hypothetical protein